MPAIWPEVEQVRLVPSTDAVPTAVNRYLLPHERQVITVHRHPAILIPSAATATGGLLAAVAVIPIVKGSESLELAIWLLAGFLFAQFISACINWSTRYLVVTSQRVLLTPRVLGSTRIKSMPLERIREMTFQRSRGGHLLGYGTFIFESNDMPYMIVNCIPYPEQLYLEVQGLVFKDKDESPD
jgi:hypothetical protein